MTPLSDEELGAVLRESFLSREELADPERAVAISRSPSRRVRRAGVTLGTVAAAASVVTVVGALVVYSARGGSDDHVSQSTATPIPTGIDEVAQKRAQDAAHEAEAVSLASSILQVVPVLPGAREFDRAPGDELKERTISPAVSENTISNTVWWLAPGTMDEAELYFREHAPQGWSADEGSGSSFDEDGAEVRFLYYLPEQVSSTLQGPEVILQLTPSGDGIAVRADSFITWRPARFASSFVHETATSALLVRSRRGEGVSRTELTGEELDQLAQSFDELPGQMATVHSCPVALNPVEYRIVFHTIDGDLVVTESGYCDPLLTVHKEGQELDPLLWESPTFRDLLDDLAPGADAS